jgi:hypothetical protein
VDERIIRKCLDQGLDCRGIADFGERRGCRRTETTAIGGQKVDLRLNDGWMPNLKYRPGSRHGHTAAITLEKPNQWLYSTSVAQPCQHRDGSLGNCRVPVSY